MKQCTKCSRTQRDGKYCLDCGQPVQNVVRETTTFKPIKTKRSPDTLKKDVRKWLNRVGVNNPEIQIFRNGESAQVIYFLKQQEYSFSSHLQSNFRNNLAAVEMFLHGRVLSIERGIESIEKAFAGYDALPDFSANPYQGFSLSVLKGLLKAYHPDTGERNDDELNKVQQEIARRKES